MKLASLLLLSLLLTAPLAATDATQPASSPTQQPQTADVFAAQMGDAQPPFALLAPQPDRELTRESGGICYKIRAYIFKRDDDHAPEMVGSTTCGPRQPHAKNVVRPKARLVPAD